MKDNNIQKRTVLILTLLNNLKDIYSELKKLSADIENYSDIFYDKLFSSSKCEIQNDIEAYKSNMEKIKQFNMSITEKINEWYDFIKDSNEIKKVIFPIKLYFRKKALKNTIIKMNRDISDISIENRFIREKIINWEQELSIRSLQEIKKGEEYNKYEELIRKKDHLVSELEYLLATIPEIGSIEFDLENIDKIIEKFLKISAA